MPFAAVIFDLDGTLLDSERQYLDAWATATETYALDGAVEFYRELIGTPYDIILERMAERYGGDFPVADFNHHLLAVLHDIRRDGTPLKAGVIDMLDRVRGLGMPCAVATSSNQRAYGKLRDSGLTDYFAVIATRDQVRKGKPAPDLFLHAAQGLSVPAHKCLAIEDSDVGLRAALAAGCTTVHIPDFAAVQDSTLKSCAGVFADMHRLADWLADQAVNSSRPGSPMAAR